MSEYQLVPYTFKVAVRNKPNELRDLDDLDGTNQLSVFDLVAKAGWAHRDAPRMADLAATRSLRVAQVMRGVRTVCLDVAVGRSGVRADVRRTRAGTISTVDVLEHDWTSTPTRCVFFAPPGAKVGTALLERVGHIGAVTDLRALLNDTLRSRYPDLILRMEPAMSSTLMEQWAEESKVKSIVLTHVDVVTGESARSVRGIPVTPVFTVKAPRRKAWSWSSLVDKLTSDTQRAILTEVVPQLPGVDPNQAGKVAQEMLDGGWRVALEVSKGGKTRTVNVDTHMSITMTFPASANGVEGRPRHDDFVAACQQALGDLDSAGLSVGAATLCAWTDTPWHDGGKDEWKAVWGVPESTTAGGSP